MPRLYQNIASPYQSAREYEARLILLFFFSVLMVNLVRLGILYERSLSIYLRAFGAARGTNHQHLPINRDETGVTSR